MKQGAIFDMDGTLLDTEKFYAEGWLVVADYFGLERNAELPRRMSGTSWGAMPDILHSFYPNVDATEYLDKVVEYCEAKTKNHLDILPGVSEILEYFKSNKISMAVASSSIRTIIEEKLQRVDLLKYFDAIVGGDEIKNSKPNPEIFLRAASIIKVIPEDCYVFEDSFNGVRAGYASGALTIMIPDQVQPTEEIRQICHVYDSMNSAKIAIERGEI